MLNTEIREYVSQMSQEQLKEVEQVIIESKVKQIVREIAKEHQLKCIDTNRNFVVNQMERGMGKSWGIALEAVYNFKPCIIKNNSNACFRNIYSIMSDIVDSINKKNNNELIKIISKKTVKDKVQYFAIQIGSKSVLIADFSEWIINDFRLKGFNTLYCDDCLPYGISGEFDKIVSYISYDEIEQVLKQCCFNKFKSE